MILYCDTSALLKRYFQEERSADVRRAWREARRVASSVVAFAEGVAAFARRWKVGDLTDDAHAKLRERLSRDLRGVIRVPVSEELDRRVSDLVVRHPLRGFDALHLASALVLRDEVRSPLLFACFDAELTLAARAAGLEVLA